jgi:methyltransferase OMS1
MGITGLRRRLAARAAGHVLELAMGTGRNLEYYTWDALTTAAERAAAETKSSSSSSSSSSGQDKAKSTPPGISSFTGLDISADMLDVARRKLVKAVPPMAAAAPVVRASTMPDHTGGQLSYLDAHLRLVNSDAHKPLPAPAPSVAAPKYDTIIQTFGLCSVSDPVAVLTNLASVVRPQTGRIILLEHGKGWFGIINGLLDRNAGKHFEKYGCWWNRDIQAIVEEAAQRTPGLEVVKVERPNILQMGTLVWVELRVTQ